jgi:hypothetical protein
LIQYDNDGIARMNGRQRRAQRRFIYMNGETDSASAAVQPRPCMMATRSVTSRSTRSLSGGHSPATQKKDFTMLSKLAVALVAASVVTLPALAQTPAPSAPKATSGTTIKADTTAVKQARHAHYLHGARLVKHATHAKYVHHVAHVKYAHHVKHVKFAHHVKPAKTHNANAVAPSGPAPAKVTTGSAAKSGVN